MKNILKRILVFLIVVLLSVSNVNSMDTINALKDVKKHKKNEIVEIYEINQEEKINIDNGFVKFYETDPNRVEILEYIKEQERLEKERQLKLEMKNNLVNFSLQFVGNPYVMGGNSLTNGTDCSGFVQLVYSNFGIYLPRTTYEQALSGITVSIEEIEKGDIISYGYDGNVTHSALYIGDGRIVHASTPELGIRIDNMYMMPIITVRRVI